MNIQRLRNLTTERLHTKIDYVYKDLGEIIGMRGLKTNMLPTALDAVTPWLWEHVTDPQFWDGEYDTSHTGEYDLPEPTDDDRAAMVERYDELNRLVNV